MLAPFSLYILFLSTEFVPVKHISVCVCVCEHEQLSCSCCITPVVSQPPSPAVPWGPSLCKKDITAEERHRDIPAEHQQAVPKTLAAPASTPTLKPRRGAHMHARLTSSSSMDWRRFLFLACWRTQTKAAYLLPQHSHLQMHFF